MRTAYKPEIRRDTACAGSTTIFFCLTLLSLLSVLFTLAEGVRILALKRGSERIVENGTNAVFSRYVDILWEKYGILGVDYTCGQEKNLETLENYGLLYAEQSGNPKTEYGRTFLRIKPDSCTIDAYGLLTDNGGTPFVRMAADKAMVETASGFLTEKLGEVNSGKEGAEDTGQVDRLLDGADGAMEETEKIKEEAAAAEAESLKENSSGSASGAADSQKTVSTPSPEEKEQIAKEQKKWEGVENPLDTVRELKKKDLMELMIPSDKSISEKSISLEQLVSTRELQKGTKRYNGSINPADQILFQQYVQKHLGTFHEECGDGVLSYGAEYIIGGKASDRDNLKSVALRILGMREAQNLISILRDQSKMNEAKSLAYAIGGITGNPGLIEVIKLGIIAAWALVESVLDLRTILAGEKIPVIKKKDQWVSSLRNLPELLRNGGKAKGTKKGMNYENYLTIFLMASQNTGLKALDLIEKDIQRTTGYASVRMDHLLCGADLSWELHSTPVFLSFVPNVPGDTGNLYDYKIKKTFSYDS